MPFQFSMRQLLLAFVILSVVCAGLASPNMWWASIAVTALAVWLLAAAAMAVGSQGQRRAYWIGALVVGLAYSTMASQGVGYSRILGAFAGFGGSRGFLESPDALLTTNLLSLAYLGIHPSKDIPVAQPAAPVWAPPSTYYPPSVPQPAVAVAPTMIYPAPSLFDSNRYARFLGVGESFFTFAFSLAGGWLAALCYSRRETSS